MLKKKNLKGDDANKVFRSLFVIMLTVTLGWFINAFIQVVIVPPFVPVEYQYEVFVYGGFPVNIASAINFVTLYMFSKEYRTTFQGMIPCLSYTPPKAFRTTAVSQNDVSKLSSNEQ